MIDVFTKGSINNVVGAPLRGRPGGIRRDLDPRGTVLWVLWMAQQEAPTPLQSTKFRSNLRGRFHGKLVCPADTTSYLHNHEEGQN